MTGNLMVGVNYEAINKISTYVERAVLKIEPDPFTDENYYPPVSSPKRDVAAYFLVMVAMDHRLSRPNRPYEGFVEGRFYHGADLLYKLGSLKFIEDPDFFYPDRLSRMTRDDLRSWLSLEYRGKRIEPPDVHIRVELLRDLGRKLLTLYNGDPFELIIRSKGFLRRDVSEGFIDALKVFKAYQDPVEKKAFLLAKFLERRGVLPIHDPHNKEVPVDNHLTRIALRLGIVSVDDETRERIAGQVNLSTDEDVMLRWTVRLAYKELSRASGVDPFILDDFLWLFGRKCCTRDMPTCRSRCRDNCRVMNGCNGGCVFQRVCRAALDPLYMVPEHRFLNTWWY